MFIWTEQNRNLCIAENITSDSSAKRGKESFPFNSIPNRFTCKASVEQLLECGSHIVRLYSNTADKLQSLSRNGSDVLNNLYNGIREIFNNQCSIVSNSKDDEGGEFPGNSQKTSKLRIPVDTTKNDNKQYGQYKVAELLLTRDDEKTENQKLQDDARNVYIIRDDPRTEINEEKDTTSESVADDGPNFYGKEKDRKQDTRATLEEDAYLDAFPEHSDHVKENKKEITTEELEVDVQYGRLDPDCQLKEYDTEDTTTKSAEDSFPHTNLELEEPEVFDLRCNNDATFNNSTTLESAPSNYSDEATRQFFFEWLRGQSWATSFYLMQNEITIYAKVGAISHSQLYNSIQHLFPRMLQRCKILFSNPGVCLPCGRPDRLTDGNRVIGTPEPQIIKHGQKISCRDIRSDKIEVGMLSGQICDSLVTVGHIVRNADLKSNEMYVDGRYLGWPLTRVETVDVPIPGTTGARSTTADILFIQMTDECLFRNIVEADLLGTGIKRRYSIVLHRGPVEENDYVIVILKNNEFRRGKIKSTDYNHETVSNALYITDDNDRAITADGDSGAIVILRPNEGDRNLKAIGIVTHLRWQEKPEFRATNGAELNAENSTALGTVVNHLYDVLLTVQQAAISGYRPQYQNLNLGALPESIEFSGLKAEEEAEEDSGIQAQGSVENQDEV